ncbi:hypothetical protein ABQ344_28810, partial [Serratia fonticola]
SSSEPRTVGNPFLGGSGLDKPQARQAVDFSGFRGAALNQSRAARRASEVYTGLIWYGGD